MKIITFNDIINSKISPELCYQWVEEALLTKENAMLPAKISLKPGEGMFYNTMPVLIPQIKRGG